MKITKFAIAGIFALTVCAIQPAAAQPPPPPATSSTAVLPMMWAMGFFVCTGLTWGKMQVDADKVHRQLTGADAFRGIGRCLFPPLGFARLIQGN